MDDHTNNFLIGLGEKAQRSWSPCESCIHSIRRQPFNKENLPRKSVNEGLQVFVNLLKLWLNKFASA
ncbi:unnamed protein product [Spodoptera exigua]|nr:unnamed protein product [Spodoptera exigua]